MGCLTRTLGRLLFVTIIISSAYLHLSKPQNYTEDLSSNYAQFTQLVNQHLPGYLPPAEAVNWTVWSKVLGLFEGVVAILIVFGDCWGGFYLFVNLLVSGFFDYQNDIHTILQWDIIRQLEFARYVLFVGASIAMMSCSFSSKQKCLAPCSKNVAQVKK